jgi:hypothetical protein
MIDFVVSSLYFVPMNLLLKGGLGLYILFVLAFLFLFSKSPLLFGWNASFHIDSQVYLYTGMKILDGKILYRDIFDHKGPMMYVFECLGLLFSNKQTIGVWLVQVVFLLGCFTPLFFYWVKKYEQIVAFSASLVFITWIYRFMNIGDNIPELFAVGFVTLLIWLAQKIIFDLEFTNLNLFFMGMLPSALMLFKFNFCVICVPVFIWLFVVAQKQKVLLRSMFVIILGSILTIIPFIIYFYLNHAIPDAIEAIWTFNLSYVHHNKMRWYYSLFEVIIQQKNYFLWFVFLVIIMKLLFANKNHSMGFMLVLIILLSFFGLVALPARGNESRHYLMPLAPVVTMIAVWLVKDTLAYLEYVLFYLSLYFLRPYFNDIRNQVIRFNDKNIIVDYMRKSNHGAPKSLFVLGNQASLYWQSGLESPVRFFYTYPILQPCEQSVTRECILALHLNVPDFICEETQYTQASCLSEIKQDYLLVMEDQGMKLFEKNIH